MPPEKVDELIALCASEGVEATVIGQFVPTGRLVLKYHGQEVADLAMEFLHDGRPPVVREAVWEQGAGSRGAGSRRVAGNSGFDARRDARERSEGGEQPVGWSRVLRVRTI